MASKRKQQAPSSAPPPKCPSSSGSHVQDGAGRSGASCNPRALSQFFSAFEIFYQQFRLMVTGAASPIEDTPDCIPDTASSSEELPRFSATLSSDSWGGGNNLSQRPQTHSQASHSRFANPRSSGSGARSSKSNPLPSQSTPDFPSILEDSQRPSQALPMEAGSETSLEDKTQEQPAVAGQHLVIIEVQDKRKKSKKHSSKKNQRSKPSDTEEDSDIILGNHLSRRKRAKILNGDYVDISLLPLARISGKGEKKQSHGRCRYRASHADRTFENWLDRFQVSMGVVVAAYPKRAMHLMAYMSHVRRAFALAGESAVLTYHEDFHRNASLLPTTHWDLRDQNYWMEHVGPYVEKQQPDATKFGKFKAKRDPCRRVCWEYNKGVCQRPNCKYALECERCLVNHPASSYFQGKQPF
ncbi:uncharacterized protein LOC118081792 [Zootoca vivipara]|uniref:uncharacterized protein LOC118081792 n=1 Tax=Zootoca vivipara TaxID=8524 RepID=UPI0015904162|nr:uncharacterized protein LOC118081792 [Zootoca vivipara]